LGHVWKETEQGWEPTEQLLTSAPPEILFIERCWQFLKPGGRMGIVLPDVILGAPGLIYVRYWMIKHCRIVASIDLHPDTFQPFTGVKTSLLILQKFLNTKIGGGVSDYEIFMAQVKAIGYDKRGNTTYKRNLEGEEILIVTDELIQFNSNEKNQKVSVFAKVTDDDTPTIANEFMDWKKEVPLSW
jgi:type I restriction enzyme M protein